MDETEARRVLSHANVEAARATVVAVTPEFDSLAAQVWAFGLAEGPRWAVAVVAQMGAELALGASHLYEAKRWYAGAALVRQLIETEYILFLFASDDEEPERWLRASSEDVQRMFSAAVMRKRAADRFRTSEYATHCEFGGHPRRRAHFLLREHDVLLGPDSVSPALQWVDLAQHIERLWRNYVAAVARHSPANAYPERFAAIDEIFSSWHATDPLANSI